MNITINTICRKAEQIKRAEERNVKCANFLKGVLATIALGAFLYALVEIPSYLHSRHCTGCDWFWCDNYTGR